MNPVEGSSNPLLEGFAPFIPLADMPAKLFHAPLAEISWRSMTPNLREQHLERINAHFVATDKTANIAVRMQIAILDSLARRNPLAPAEQRRINQLALLHPDTAHDVLPTLADSATAGILASLTGMGKSCFINRALEVIAPEQILVHSKSNAGGWSKLVQIAYLKLDFPSNGSRGGLVERILAAVDQLIGTDYSDRNRRLRNLDASLVLVMKVLSMHRVGMLVLDELQPDNFDWCQWWREFVLYLLSLLNLGVPLMLCGQPGAFRQIKEEQQTLRRFSAIGNYLLTPASPGGEEWWTKGLVPGIMRFNLCEEIQDLQEMTRISRDGAVGVPGFFACIWKEAQRLALRRDGAVAKLTLEDFNKASRCEAVFELMNMARQKDLSTNVNHIVAVNDGAPLPSASSSRTKPKTFRAADQMQSPITQAIRKVRSQDKRRQSKAVQRDLRTAELLKALSPEDVRSGNRALDLLASADESGSLPR